MSTGETSTTRRPVLRYVGWSIALCLAAAFIGLLGYGLLTTAPDSTIDDALAKAQPVRAPGFELEVLSRGTVPATLAPVLRSATRDDILGLDELRGTPIVLNFWASWCPPCRDEAPILQRAWARYGPRGVLFLGQNMQDVRSDARGFIAAFKQTFPNVRDPTNNTARAWGASGLPETFFIRRDGRVVGHVIGAVTESQLARGISDARAGRAAQAARGGEQRPTR